MKTDQVTTSLCFEVKSQNLSQLTLIAIKYFNLSNVLVDFKCVFKFFLTVRKIKIFTARPQTSRLCNLMLCGGFKKCRLHKLFA